MGADPFECDFPTLSIGSPVPAAPESLSDGGLTDSVTEPRPQRRPWLTTSVRRNNTVGSTAAAGAPTPVDAPPTGPFAAIPGPRKPIDDAVPTQDATHIDRDEPPITTRPSWLRRFAARIGLAQPPH